MHTLIFSSGSQSLLTRAEVTNLLRACPFQTRRQYEQTYFQFDGFIVVCPRGSDWRSLLPC